jgi:hypothetical protein
MYVLELPTHFTLLETKNNSESNTSNAMFLFQRYDDSQPYNSNGKLIYVSLWCILYILRLRKLCVHGQ